MKKVNYVGGLLLICLLAFSSVSYAQKKKVACVGNSITEGWGLPAHWSQSYPAVLQEFLGTANFTVNNYGASGSAMVRKSGYSYWSTSQYTNALAMKPDIVIIKLGTNDANSSNWMYKNDFKKDYIDFIRSFQALSSKPKIYACYPIPAYPENDSRALAITNEMLPMLDEIVAETGVTLLDLYTPFLNKKYLMGDDLHPNVAGARYLAYLVAQTIDPEFKADIDIINLSSYIAPFDQTDKSLEKSSSVAGLDLNPLIDNNASTFIITPFQANMYIGVTLPAETKITSYALTSGEAAGSPKSWELQALSGGSWVKIHEQQNITFQAYETKVFNIVYDTYANIRNSSAYRLVIKDKNGGSNLILAEWQLFGSQSTFESSITSNGGTITDQYNSTGHEGVQYLIDRNGNTKFCSVEKGTGIWMKYVSTKPSKLQRYTLTSANDAPERDPIDWTLEGSNDGINWEVLDTQTNQNFISRFSTMEYKVTGANADKYYLQFRLNVSKMVSGKTFQLAEWQLFGNEVPRIKVACIGNSITEGIGVSSGDDTYPSILQKNLGLVQYEVRNFGASGRVMTKEPVAAIGWSYWTHPRYQQSLDWEPDIVIIKLGTNDSDPSRWPTYKDHFKADYIDMVNSFKNLSSSPKVYVCYPIPLSTASLATQENNLATGVIPMITEVATETGSTIIDLHTPLMKKSYMTPDGCHPNKKGTTYMAHIVAKALCQDCELPALPSDLFLFLSSFDQTDKGVPSASVSGLDMASLIDNNPSTAINAPFTKGEDVWFQIELPGDLKMSAYSITSDAAENSPKSWELQGLSSTGTWTKIDEQKDVVFLSAETKVFDSYFTAYSGLKNYKEYRLLIKDNNGGETIGLKEWQIFGSPANAEVSVTYNGGLITDQYNLTGNEGVQSLIDKKIDTKYCAVDKGTSYWIQYVSPVPVKLGRYALTSANDAPGRDPVDWKLEVSNTGNRWIEIDKRSNQEFVGRFSTLEYQATTTSEYTHFRLTVNRLKDGNTFQLAEWQLFEDKPSSLPANSVGNVFVSSGNNTISIRSDATESVKYAIYDVFGRHMAEDDILPGTEVQKNFSSGIYIISLTSFSGKTVVKVIL